MNFIEKIELITEILESVSSPKSIKRPYDLPTIARGIYIHFKANVPYPKIPLWGTGYSRKNYQTAYIYWIKLLKSANKMNDVLTIIYKL